METPTPQSPTKMPHVIFGIMFILFGSMVFIFGALKYAASFDLFVHAKDQQTSYYDVVVKPGR